MIGEKKKKEITMNFTELLNLIKQYIIFVLIAGVVGGLIAFAISAFAVDPVYEANATMIVNTRNDQKTNITNDQITSAQKLVDTYSVIIKSRTVLNPVVEKLNLEGTYKNLLKRVDVSSVNGTQIMRISVRDKDPQMAETILKEMLSIAPKVIKDSIEAGSVKTVEAPYCSYVPVAPNNLLNAFVTAVLCMAVSLAIIVFRFLNDNTYKTELDIQNSFDFPVIGVIPSLESCVVDEQKHNSKEKKK